MGKFIVIECLVPTSVSIDDMGVHLPGKGSKKTVLASSAEASADLRQRISARQVSISYAGQSTIRTWPFVPPIVLPDLPPPAPLPPPEPVLLSSENQDVVRLLAGINEKLGILILRPSAPPAEVVAAHVRAISSLASVPDGLPGSPHPQFIPSSILPSDPKAGEDIKVKSEVSVGVDASISALKNLRKGK